MACIGHFSHSTTITRLWADRRVNVTTPKNLRFCLRLTFSYSQRWFTVMIRVYWANKRIDHAEQGLLQSLLIWTASCLFGLQFVFHLKVLSALLDTFHQLLSASYKFPDSFLKDQLDQQFAIRIPARLYHILRIIKKRNQIFLLIFYLKMELLVLAH